MISGSFFLTIVAALNLLKTSITCKYQKFLPISCKSRATTWLKSFAREKATTGLGFARLNLWHTTHDEHTSLTISLTSESTEPALLRRDMSFSKDAWPN